MQWPESHIGPRLEPVPSFWAAFIISSVSPFPYPSLQLTSFLLAEAPGARLSVQDSSQSLRSGLRSVSWECQHPRCLSLSKILLVKSASRMENERSANKFLQFGNLDTLLYRWCRRLIKRKGQIVWDIIAYLGDAPRFH